MDDRQLRASDAERDAVIDTLRTHTAEGRLTLTEFEERVGEALSATTRADLEEVLRELPPLEPAVRAGRDRARPSWWSQVNLSRAAGIVVAVVALTIVLQGGFLWWLIPLFFWTGGFGLFGGCSRGARGQGFCAPAFSKPDSDEATNLRRSSPSGVPRHLTEV